MRIVRAIQISMRAAVHCATLVTAGRADNWEAPFSSRVPPAGHVHSRCRRAWDRND
jgi:hypothetical protein